MTFSPRVLFLTESFHPVLGGGERHIRALGRGLVEAGLAVSVMTRRTEREWPAEEALDGMRVVRVGPSGQGLTGKYAMTPRVVRALGREPFDLLVVRGTRVLGLPGLLMGRLLGRPVVLQAEINGELSGEAYTWGTPLQDSPLRPLLTAAVALRNRFWRDADAFVAMSAAIRREFLAAGVPEDRAHLIPHGVDTERYHPVDPVEKVALRRRLGLPEEAKVIAYTGRLLRGKGLEVLLEAFTAVVATEPEAVLLFVGSGEGQSLSVEDQLKARTQEAGLGTRVRFTGRVDDVETWLQAADVFAFPSEFEALGLSLIEAASCGLPAAGSRTGGIVDVIEDGRSGLLVPPGDPLAWRDALLRLLRSADERRSFGLRAREVARSRFDDRDNVLPYRALFLELMRRGACSPARAPRADATLPR